MIMFLASRYAFSKSAHHRASSIRIMITTALSLVVVVVIISIMDFLQDSRFKQIREVRSFDLVVEGRHGDELKELYPDATIFEYGEGEAMIDGNAFLVRYIDSNYDGGLRLVGGSFDGLAIPYSLYRLDNRQNHIVSLLRKGRSGVVIPRSIEMDISGIYASRMGSEFDSSHVFMPISSSDSSTVFKTAIRGIDISEKTNLIALGYDVTTWKDSESGLYSAFVIEKTMMYMVLALLFVVILVSTKQSVRIFYREKRKERAELEVLGLSEPMIALSFLLSFLIILMLSIAIALIASMVLLPSIERFCSKYIIFGTVLEFPLNAFIGFSAILFLVTVFFSINERRKDKIFDLVEVINAK